MFERPITNSSDYYDLARKYYDNPACMSISEFESDVKRISFFGRLVEKDASARQLINSVIIIYNLFGYGAFQLAEYKLSGESFSIFKSISILLNKIIGDLPEEHNWLSKEIFK